MSNVYSFSKLGQVQHPSRPMSDRERETLGSSIRKISLDQPHPLSRILTVFSISVRDYPIEDVVLKDLGKSGYVITASYPNHNLHWVFRLESSISLPTNVGLTPEDLFKEFEDGLVQIGSSSHAARFPYRFLLALDKYIVLKCIERDENCLIVSGFIRVSEIGPLTTRPYLPFKMTMTLLKKA